MNVWLVDIASGRRMRDRKLYYVHCFRLDSRQKETVMQYILTVILIFLPWGLAAQKIAPLYIVTDFQLVRI